MCVATGYTILCFHLMPKHFLGHVVWVKRHMQHARPQGFEKRTQSWISVMISENVTVKHNSSEPPRTGMCKHMFIEFYSFVTGANV